MATTAPTAIVKLLDPTGCEMFTSADVAAPLPRAFHVPSKEHGPGPVAVIDSTAASILTGIEMIAESKKVKVQIPRSISIFHNRAQVRTNPLRHPPSSADHLRF